MRLIFLLELLDSKPMEVSLKRKAIAIMNQTGSFEATRVMLQAVKSGLQKLIEKHRADSEGFKLMNAALENFLQKLYLPE